MTTAARLVLVRHGETVWNLEGRLQGYLDSDLSPRGVAQAAALARRFKDFRLAALYSSDLGRAMETARMIATACRLEVVPDPRLRERNLGLFEGLTKAEIQERHPEVWSRYVSQGPDFIIPNGESARQRFERSIAALREIAERHQEQCVGVVAHGGTLNTAFRACTGMSLDAPKSFSLLNASINVVEYRAGTWEIVTWGDTAHLGGDGGLDDG